jgi:hypothetical protein
MDGRLLGDIDTIAMRVQDDIGSMQDSKTMLMHDPLFCPSINFTKLRQAQ